jgi:hypothetical protein
MNAAEVVKSLGKELDALLRDIPIEHIVKGVQVYNRALFVRYFKGYRLQIAGKKRVRALVDREIKEKGSEELAQLLMTLWNRANGRLYHAVYSHVRTVNEEVDKIERIDDEVAGEFLGTLLEEFDADRLYLCILFNEVKVSREIVKEKLGKEIPFAEWPPKPEPEEEADGESEQDGDASPVPPQE